MKATIELQHRIERELLPLVGKCIIYPDRSMMVQIADPATGVNRLTVTGIASGELTSDEAIADLVSGLRDDYNAILGIGRQL